MDPRTICRKKYKKGYPEVLKTASRSHFFGSEVVFTVNLIKEAEFLPKSCQPHGEVVDWHPIWEELEKEEAAKAGGSPKILEVTLEHCITPIIFKKKTRIFCKQ
jgi:hypothetical protein